MTEAAPIRPIKLAHVVLKTARFAEIVAWYKQALSAEAAFENEMIAFLTYDDEHHRIAVLNIPGLGPRQAGASGVHHVAFTFGSLGDLLGTFERLDKKGIKPVFCTNHGPTTSIYYADPDGNQVEFQVDNFATNEEAARFFTSSAFAENPIGVDFDPHELLRRLRGGESERELKAYHPIGPRGFEGLPLT
ncbi:MAG: VOC family protein [Reyranella sp.]|nr:VOC family protein [Reyranella sp.]